MKRRAFSLLEVSVAAALGLMLLTILVTALLPLLRSSRIALQRLELSQIASGLRTRLLEDLQAAPPIALNYPGPASFCHFSLQPVEQVGPNGKPAYANYLVVYEVNLANGTLSRRVCQPGGLAVDYPDSFTEPQLASYFSQSAGPIKILANGTLKSFQLGSLTAQRAELKRLQFMLQANTQSYSWDETVALRNGNL